jgi:hypothetical protein
MGADCDTPRLPGLPVLDDVDLASCWMDDTAKSAHSITQRTSRVLCGGQVSAETNRLEILPCMFGVLEVDGKRPGKQNQVSARNVLKTA